MTAQQFLALTLKRAFEVKELVDIESMMEQGYSPIEICDYMYDLMAAQIKRDIVPLSIIEAAAIVGKPVDYVAEVTKEMFAKMEGGDHGQQFKVSKFWGQKSGFHRFCPKTSLFSPCFIECKKPK